MMKKIKEVLHLYIGQKIRWNHGGEETLSFEVADAIIHDNLTAKLLLRPLSDMSVKEAMEIDEKLFYGISNTRLLSRGAKLNMSVCQAAELTTELLSRGFDVFSLLHSKEALPPQIN